VRWVFDACSPDCFDNSLAGEIEAGDAFPTGHAHPPAFVGCRCLLAVAAGPGAATAGPGRPRNHISAAPV
jgi:hypothetical protein